MKIFAKKNNMVVYKYDVSDNAVRKWAKQYKLI